MPLAGVLYVVFLALYSDATGQTQLLVAAPRPSAVSVLRQVLRPRHGAATGVGAVSTPAAEPLSNARLATLVDEQAVLSAQFAAGEAAQEVPASPSAGTNAPPPADAGERQPAA